MCIGYGFAMQAMELVVARIVQRYRLVLEPGQRVDTRIRITLAPKAPLYVSVRPTGQPGSRVRVRGQIRELVDLDHPPTPERAAPLGALGPST